MTHSPNKKIIDVQAKQLSYIMKKARKSKRREAIKAKKSIIDIHSEKR